MSTSNLFFKGCTSSDLNLDEEQKLKWDEMNAKLIADGEQPVSLSLVDESCARETNTCGMDLRQLLDTYELYDFQRGVFFRKWGDVIFPWELSPTTTNLDYDASRKEWSNVNYVGLTSYYAGDKVLYIEDDGYAISVYEANQNIPAPAGPLDRTKWDKFCSIEFSHPVELPTIEELIATYEFYFLKEFLEDWGEASEEWNIDLQGRSSDEWDEYKIRREFFYKVGEFVLVEGECGDAFCLWINIKDIAVTDQNIIDFAMFSPVVNGERYWEKIYCVDSGRNKCLGPQSDRNLDNYQFVEIGSKGHYVEQPIPHYKLKGNYLCDKDNHETLEEAAALQPSRVLTQNEIDYLDGLVDEITDPSSFGNEIPPPSTASTVSSTPPWLAPPPITPPPEPEPEPISSWLRPPEELVPIAVNGYYPLYTSEANALTNPRGDGTTHTHTFNGVTYYMPGGLGSGQYHGTYGQQQPTPTLPPSYSPPSPLPTPTPTPTQPPAPTPTYSPPASTPTPPASSPAASPPASPPPSPPPSQGGGYGGYGGY